MLNKKLLDTSDWTSRYKAKLLGTGTVEKLTMCKKCYSFYYKNSWHFEMPAYASDYQEENIPVILVKCGACLREENDIYDMESMQSMESLLGKGYLPN